MIKRTITLLSLLTLTYAGGFQGTITSSLGDQVAGAHIIGKHGNTVVVDTFANDAGEYLLNWSTVGIAGGIDFKLPSTKLTALGNSITSDGRVYPFLDGSPDNVAYRVYDLSGREVTDSPVYAQGKYFLQVFNQATGKILGVESFIYLNGNGLDVQFKADLHSPNSLAKAMEDTDSLIVEYTGSGMLLERYAEAVVVPESYETRDIVLTRTLQNIVIEFSGVPENPTIDATYVIIINAVSPDYDNHITEVGVFHISGDSINYEFNGVDSLVISPHTQGDHEFHVLATGEYSHRGRNIELSVESQVHLVQTLDFFYALDEPYPGLEVYLRDKYSLTDIDGIAKLEFPSTAPPLTIQDSIEIYHPTNDTTFYAMRLPVDTEVDTQKVSTLTDPKGPTYWTMWSYAHILNRESSSGGLFTTDFYSWPEFGNIEGGNRDTVFVYCPDFISGSDGHVLRLAFRPVIDSLLQQRNQKLDERAGQSNQSKVHYYLLENTIEDSVFADYHGIMLFFDGTANFTQNTYESDALEDLYYINSVDAHVSNNITSEETQRLVNLVDHEALQHGSGLIAHTPYNFDYPENQENMNVGASDSLKDLELDGLFFRLNYEPSNIRHFIGHETFHIDN